jgi:hypothetical protein
VGVSGTSAGLSAQIRAAAHSSVTVLAKTGTLNETSGRFKALAIVVGIPDGNAGSAPLKCGLVATTYFEFGDERAAGTRNVALLPLHLDFAHGPLASVLSRHWERMSGCTPPGKPIPNDTNARRTVGTAG